MVFGSQEYDAEMEHVVDEKDLLRYPLTQWLGEDRKTHRVGFADLTEYRVRDKSRRVSRKVTEYSHILTEYLTELFHRVHWVRFKFLFFHRVFGRKLTEFTEFTRSRVFSPSSRPSEFPRVTVPGGNVKMVPTTNGLFIYNQILTLPVAGFFGDLRSGGFILTPPPP